MRLSKKTWITRDAAGCEFVCTAYYAGSETVYVAGGFNPPIEAKTLKALKKAVAEYKR